jgi:serine phosphatase RsbU (regulator of sigma subunit)
MAELQKAVQAQSDAARQVAALAEAALEIATATTVDELTGIVLDRGVKAIGADGGAIAVRDDTAGTVSLSITDSLGPRTQLQYAQLDLDNPLPAAYVARTGETVLLPDRAAGLAWSPLMTDVYDVSGRLAWATVPLRAGDRLLGSLVASWALEREFDRREVEILHAFAAQLAQALDRIRRLAEERARAAATRSLSETLQRSLLTRPPQVNHLQLAVRYEAAAEHARVGGDWYDALLTPDGALIVTVGDCAGHDQAAAAAMASVRTLMRSTAYLIDKPPAEVLSALEAQLAGLEIDALATAVLARIEQPAGYAQRGMRRLTWSNAGHLPPLLLHADGTVDILSTEPDLMLGLVTGTGRGNHSIDLPPSATLLLYTDGLTERRGEDLDAGIARLAAALAELGDLPLETLCDRILRHMLPAATPDDDVALLALRMLPEDRPRPAEAGRNRTPDARNAGATSQENATPGMTELPLQA